MYSDWFTPVWNVYDGSLWKVMSITESRLTPEFLEKGVVLVYHRWKNFPVPNVYLLSYSTSHKRISSYIKEDGSIYIRADSFDGGFLNNETAATNNWFRYVLIPGGVDISALERQGIDLNNYEEISETFNIPK